MTLRNAVENLDLINKNIEFSRLQNNAHHIVKVVGISKYHTTNEVMTLYKAGQRAFGENKVQDLKQKMDELNEFPIEWHFVGNLQKNKINALIDCDPFLVHSLDGYEFASELDKRLKIKNKTMNCLLQINSANEDTKSGIDAENAIKIYKKITNDFSNINLKGVMSIGAHTDDTKTIKESFEKTKQIFDKLQVFGAKICSMGMSSDYNLAIACGSNMIRVGNILFKDEEVI